MTEEEIIQKLVAIANEFDEECDRLSWQEIELIRRNQRDQIF